MSYLLHNLLKGERIILQPKFHWVMYLPPVLVFLCLMTAAGTVAAKNFFAGAVVASIALLVGMPLFVRQCVKIRSVEFVVTDRRVMLMTGLIGSEIQEFPLAQIHSVEVKQGTLGRLFGYGTVTIIDKASVIREYEMVAKPWNLKFALMPHEVCKSSNLCTTEG